MSKEAHYAENMTNLFLIEMSQREFEDFNKIIGEPIETQNKEYAAPVLSEETISKIRIYLRKLLQQWYELPSR